MTERLYLVIKKKKKKRNHFILVRFMADQEPVLEILGTLGMLGTLEDEARRTKCTDDFKVHKMVCAYYKYSSQFTMYMMH